MNQKNYEQALECFQKGLEIAGEGEKQRLLYGEAVAYEYLLDFDTAREKLEAYLAEYPDDANALRDKRFLQGEE